MEEQSSDYKRYGSFCCGDITKKIISKRMKSLKDESVQEAKQEFYLTTRKANTTEKERSELCSRINFDIVGDPVGNFYGNTRYFLGKCKTCGFLRNMAISDIKSGIVSCTSCLTNRLKDEASNFGLEMLGDSTDGKTAKRNYKFTSCGHKRDIATADVRLGHVSCTECYSNKISKLMEFRGLVDAKINESDTPINHKYSKVQYEKCGHSRFIIKHQLNRDIGYCQVCYEDELQKKYGDVYGFDIIESVSGAKRKIRFRGCNHDKIVGISNMKSGNVRCIPCQEQKWKSEAEDAELTWLSCGNNKHHKYLAPCGHELLVKPACVRVGHWTCRECDSGWFERPNNIYLFRAKSNDGFEFLKLGYSLKPENRKNDYKLSDISEIKLLVKVKVDTGKIAVSVENSLHRKYKEFNLDAKLMKKYLTESGFTECYPVNIESKLLNDLKEINE